MTVDVLLSRLEGVKRTRHACWIARCPAHTDKKPSLSIREIDDGTVLINDFGGCGATDILAAVGLRFDELFPPKPVDHFKPMRRPVFREDLFQIIRFEASVVWLIACDMHTGKRVSDEDYKRLGDAVSWLERIKDAAYGSR
jgi:hypothetical protein